MRSIAAHTDEVIDIELGLSELRAQLNRSEKLLKNSVGIAFCDSECIDNDLGRKLQDAFPFPVIGATSLAMFSNSGFVASGINLLVLTADDCQFSLAHTGELNDANMEERIRDVYRDLTSHTAPPASLTLGFIGSMKLSRKARLNEILTQLDSGIPFFGGCASDDLSLESTRVFCQGQTMRTGLCLLQIRGNVRPLFTVAFKKEHFTSLQALPERFEDDTVYTMRDSQGKCASFVDYLHAHNIETKGDGLNLDHYFTPFLLQTRQGYRHCPVLRFLQRLNSDNGSALFSGIIPHNTDSIAHGLLSAQDILDDVSTGMHTISQAIAQCDDPSYRYSTLICLSCASRALVLSPQPHREGECLKERLPSGLNLAGMYALAEYCPDTVSDTTSTPILTYNGALALLAL